MADRTWKWTGGGEVDPRLNLGLLFDVARVLEEHGYPAPKNEALLSLQQTLFRFVHGEGQRETTEGGGHVHG